MDTQEEILEQLRQVNILTRVNNALLARFIVQLQTFKRELHLPKVIPFFKFELLEDEYQELVEQFGKKDVLKALFVLDRMLIANKMECPNNVRKYIANRLKRLAKGKELRKKYSNNETEKETE